MLSTYKSTLLGHKFLLILKKQVCCQSEELLTVLVLRLNIIIAIPHGTMIYQDAEQPKQWPFAVAISNPLTYHLKTFLKPFPDSLSFATKQAVYDQLSSIGDHYRRRRFFYQLAVFRLLWDNKHCFIPLFSPRVKVLFDVRIRD